MFSQTTDLTQTLMEMRGRARAKNYKW